MANPKRSFHDNVPGSWYVDEECIACSQCGTDLPEIFGETADYDHYRVHRQPVTPEEIRAADDARERCPTEAIGNDRAS